MILREIRLHPFGGVKDRTVTLGRGLTVILGPNEAGKSTLLAALRHALFTSTKLTPARFKTELSQFLPLAGGDAIRVSLNMQTREGPATLTKCWAAGKSSASLLVQAQGGELSDPDGVDRRMREILQYAEGTYDGILCTAQAQLSGTMMLLRKEPVATTSRLADLLRRSVFQADGVSVEKLVEMVKAREEEAFGRWDKRTSRPQDGRDIDRPWEKGVGSILRSYYAWQQAEKALRDAEEYEKRVDAYAARMRALAAKVESLDGIVHLHAPLVEDARKRVEFTRTLEEARTAALTLQSVAELWPRNEARLEALEQDIVRLRKCYEGLRNDYRDAVKARDHAVLRTTYEKACAAQEALERERGILRELPSFRDEDIRALRESEASLRDAEIRLAARQLAVRIETRSEFSGRMSDSTGKRDVVADSGAPFDATVRGFFRLEHSEWTLSVNPVDTAASDPMMDVERWSTRANELRKTLGVMSAEEAVAKRKAHDDQSARCQRAQAVVETLTNKEPLEVMARAVAGLPSPHTGRDPEALHEEMVETEREGLRKVAEKEAMQKQCGEWGKTYGNIAQVIDLLARKKAAEAQARDQLAMLKPLPPPFTDAAAFIADFEQKRSEVERVKQEHHGIALERAGFERPDRPRADEGLRDDAARRKSEFEHAKARGAAYEMIRRELESLLHANDAGTVTPMKTRMEELLVELTGNRYTSVELQGMVPARVQGSGLSLPIEAASQGTLDVLALAVRLAMAEYSLDSQEGFVILDDPLVNMDPDRQISACHSIQRFASTHQTIVLTCHPSMAELLGGTLVRVGPRADS